MNSPDPITRLNAALEGRYRIERELGEPLGGIERNNSATVGLVTVAVAAHIGWWQQRQWCGRAPRARGPSGEPSHTLPSEPRPVGTWRRSAGTDHATTCAARRSDPVTGTLRPGRRTLRDPLLPVVVFIGLLPHMWPSGPLICSGTLVPAWGRSPSHQLLLTHRGCGSRALHAAGGRLLRSGTGWPSFAMTR